MGELAKDEITDKFLDEHLMILKAKFNDEQPWYADYINYIVGKVTEDAWMKMKSLKSWHTAIPVPLGDITVPQLQEEKFTRQDPIGPISLKMLKIMGNIYILVAVDYVSKWVKAQALLTNDARVVIEHKAYWALKQCNMDLMTTAKNHFMELNELMELRDGSYENTQIYEERIKRWHDSRLRGDKNFINGDKFLLFNSLLKLHPGKIKSKWSGPFVVKTVYPYGAVEITNNNGLSFKDLAIRKLTIWYTLKKTCVDLVRAF
ncbi:hypothetical protein Tco_1192917 [Tanacetum coccineum]